MHMVIQLLQRREHNAWWATHDHLRLLVHDPLEALPSVISLVEVSKSNEVPGTSPYFEHTWAILIGNDTTVTSTLLMIPATIFLSTFVIEDNMF